MDKTTALRRFTAGLTPQLSTFLTGLATGEGFTLAFRKVGPKPTALAAFLAESAPSSIQPYS